MYRECSRNKPRHHKASFASKSSTFTGSSSSGNSSRTASSEAVRETPPFSPSSPNKKSPRPKHTGEPKETWQTRDDTQLGCRSASLDMHTAHPPCRRTSFPYYRANDRHDQHPNQFSYFSREPHEESYRYNSSCVTESFLRSPGPPYHQCQLTPDEDEVVQDAGFYRLRNEYVDQSPAPPQSPCQPPLFSPPRWRAELPLIDRDEANPDSSTGPMPAVYGGTSKVERDADKAPPTSSKAFLRGPSLGLYRNAVVGPLRVLLDWGYHILDWVRSTSSLVQNQRGRETPVRSRSFAWADEYESSHEALSCNESEPDSGSTLWIGSEYGDEEDEVEMELCTPPQSGMELQKEVNSCYIHPSGTCQEHLHLDLEVQDWEELFEDHLSAPIHLQERTACNGIIFSSSPDIPHAVVGHYPVGTFRLVKTTDHNRLCTPPDAGCALDTEGDIKLTRKDASSEALLSDHMHPRWRHYRFTTHNLANDIVMEEKVPVTYLDEGAVEAERLKEMFDAGKLQLEWGVGKEMTHWRW